MRRAVGDPSLGRMDPHLTLVPPVNVHSRDMAGAIALIRSAAAGQAGPLSVTIGPPATFLPDNPVLYLGVGGGDLERLSDLRDGVFTGPFARKLTWPWVPHVTLGDGIEEERITAGVAVLQGYAAVTSVDRVVLLEEQPGRLWRPIADAALGPPAVVGTGGLEVMLTRGRIIGPDAASLVGGAPALDATARGSTGRLVAPPIVLTASLASDSAGVGREVVGAAQAWADLSGAHVAVAVAEQHRHQGIGGHLLAHVESAARSAGWEHHTLEAEGPAGFYQARSAWAVPVTRTRRRSTRPAS